MDKTTYATASTVIVLAAATFSSGSAVAVHGRSAERPAYNLRTDALSPGSRIRLASVVDPDDAPVGYVEFSEFTAADKAMMNYAAQAGVDETDFSEFYLDDDE